MVTVDTLNTKFTLDAGQYNAAAGHATAQTNQFAAAAARAKAAQGKGGLGGAFDDLKDSAKSAADAFAPLKNLIAGIVGVGVAGVAGGYSLMKQAAEFDSLKQSLISVEGSAKGAEAALRRLKELAKAPGLGFEQAVQGYTGLRNAGLSEGFADRIIKEFANANARGGGNAETFGRILTQIRQAASRQFLAQEDLVPIGEAGVPINKILKDKFGTGDTEELKKRGIDAQTALHGIVEELSKLQRVAGGEQNEFDNLGDAIKFASISAGEASNQSLLPYFTKLANAAGELSDSGVIQDAFSSIAENVMTIIGGAGDDTAESLIPLVATLTTASAGFRNLTENIKGFVDTVEDQFRHSIVGRVLGLGKDKKDQGEGQGTDLFSEYGRTVDEMTARLEANRKIRAEREKRGLNPDGSKKTTPKDDDSKTSPVVPLLQRIAVATEKQADLQTQLSGGSTLAKDVTSAYGMHKTLRGHGELVDALQTVLDVISAGLGGVTVAVGRQRLQNG